MEPRNAAFVELKPACVALSKAILSWNGGQSDGSLVAVLDGLSVLSRILKRPKISVALDEKLADYVFFPLSAALQRLEKLPVRAREIILESILVLLETAWHNNVNADLGLQLVILITFMLDPGNFNPEQRTDFEALDSVCLQCLARIFTALQNSSNGKKALLDPMHAPQIGKTLTVILSYATRSCEVEVQTAALDAVSSFFTAWPDRESLCLKFFPGSVSSLTKLLSAKPGQKTHSKMIMKAISILKDIIVTVLSDAYTENLSETGSESETTTVLDKRWLSGTSAQVKMALSNVMRLRNHSNTQIRAALAKLCLHILETCWKSLAESLEMLLETLIIVAVNDEKVLGDIRFFIMTQPSIFSILRTTVYNSIQSLPRVMLSADDDLRKRTLAQVATTLTLLHDDGADLTILHDILGRNIRDGVVNAIARSASGVAVESVPSLQLEDLNRREFGMTISSTISQTRILSEFDSLFVFIGTTDSASQMALQLADDLRRTTGDAQLASFWTSLQLARSAVRNSVSNLVALVDAESELVQVLDMLFSFSLDGLSEQATHKQDWRVQALALQCVVLQAQYYGADFRAELIECLYPVVQCLGSEIVDLRETAITAVNLLADLCGYSSSGQMIISNVDYMVNAISLRLNSFDITPQAPLVLSMLVKLTGPKLLPYLDDVVDSVFALLAAYHGYPRLVEQLFEVLKAVADQGAVDERLKINVAPGSLADTNHIAGHGTMTIEALAQELLSSKARIFASEEQSTEHSIGTTREQWLEEWGDGVKSTDPDVDDANSTDNVAMEQKSSDNEQKTLSKTYSLLLSIAQLTQHYLTSSSLELRIKLLSLLKAVLPMLAQDEDSFLPLINTLWPVIIPRLHDSEDFVISGALDVIATLCEHAKGFMTSRLEEAWPILSSLSERHVNRNARAQPKLATNLSLAVQTAGLGSSAFSHAPAMSLAQSYTSPDIVRRSHISLMITILEKVQTSEEMADDVVAQLMPFSHTNAAVRQTLAACQSDILWLRSWRHKPDAAGQTSTAIKDNSRIVLPEAITWRFAAAAR